LTGSQYVGDISRSLASWQRKTETQYTDRVTAGSLKIVVREVSMNFTRVFFSFVVGR
jgi:hypothetical protein